MLKTTRASIGGAIAITTEAFIDGRGSFKEAYVHSKYEALGISDHFIQDNVSVSRQGALRGLHTDPRMSKLVYVVRGRVFDVVVDARRDSPTFGRWEGFDLSSENNAQLYIPAGCLHGFLAVTDDVIFCYKQSAEYAPEREIGVRWDDPDLAIAWPLTGAPLVSPKDSANRSFRDAFGAGA